ncbi:tetratricopeptide repeat protein [Streptomyces uncialis]|uniref:tetratricopeptide repeat protein n=1 Tax=Streptomyces uncialis TaxID=1048205 RepID=UPI003870848C|nr:trypsin-like peptidase domain-containing protein [Streptomyces uncialis]
MREPEGTSNSAVHEGGWRVRLFQEDAPGSPPLGAGVLLAGGHVLTCAHVVLLPRLPAAHDDRDDDPEPAGYESLERVVAEFPTAFGAPGRLPARVLLQHLRPPTPGYSADLALLKLERVPGAQPLRVTPAVLHRQIPARNEQVHAVGYPDYLIGGEYVNARIMGRGGPGLYPEWVQLDPESSPYVIRHGFSGSGVVHSRTGRVIGILVHQHGTERVPVPLSHAYMIPTETILRHLRPGEHGLKVLGPRAVSRGIRADAIPPGAQERALGLRYLMTRWLGAGGTVVGSGHGGGTHQGTTLTWGSAAEGSASASGRPVREAGAVAEPVELAFVHDDEPDAWAAVRSTLVRADRERYPDPADPGGPVEPRAGSIDIALDAKGWTAAELVDRTAARAGLDDLEPTDPDPARDPVPTTGRAPDADSAPDADGDRPPPDGPPNADGSPGADGPPNADGPPDADRPPDSDRPSTRTDRLLARIAEEGPPLSAAFLSADRAAHRPDAVLPLLHALLEPGHSRVLLVLRERTSPLLARVVRELLDPGWAQRHADAIAARLNALGGLERRVRHVRRTATAPPPPDSADPAPQSPEPPAPRGADPVPEVPAPAPDGPDPVSVRLRARLDALRRGGVLSNTEDVVYELFRLRTEVEDAVQALRLPYPSRRYVVKPPTDGLTDLPNVVVGRPDRLVESEPGEPGDGAAGPGLSRGQELHQQYLVIGRLGQGTYGEVYLAHDRMLEDRAVALKGVRDPADPDAEKTASTERVRLVSLNHPAIIKVFNYARHPDPDSNARFIVMEFANGAPLAWVADQIGRRVAPFHDYRVHEFIAAYGLRILDALTYLHVEREFVYGDLSLTNVIHCGEGIKLIDVAGVRKIGDPGPVTYRAPETGLSTRVTVAAELYAVGKLLEKLLDRAPEDPAGLGATSLRGVLTRAMAPLPAARFASAEEMSVQLRGVLRELRSLRLGAETFEPSPLFATAPAALDGALGKAPPLDQWRQGGNRKRKLSSTRPTPPEVALGLPVPRPDDSDRNRTELQRTSYDDPAGLLQLSEVWRESPERALLRCRLHLEIARDHPAEAARELRRAERELALAATAVGEPAAHDWRLDWHHGLLWLSRGEVTPALECFTRVNAAIPGEYAPKLAMGYCQEFGDNPKEAVRLYGAVWQRNRALGGAAFGLARIHVGHGKPQLALDCLEAVPADSRHRTAARTAMVRILADPPDGDVRPTPQAAARAWVALHRLTLREGLTDRHAQERLRADLLELLLRLDPAEDGTGQRARVRRRPGGARAPQPDPLQALHQELAGAPEAARLPRTVRDLHEELAACYLRLAEQVPPAPRDAYRELAGALVDNAYLTRPVGLTHNRGEPRHRLLRPWTRGPATTQPTPAEEERR